MTTRTEAVGLHITDCNDCKEHDNNRDCNHFKSILELIKSLREDAETKKYKFEVIKETKRSFTIPLNSLIPITKTDTINTIHMAEITIDGKEIIKDVNRICAYMNVKVREDNKKFNRIFIVRKIKTGKEECK